MNKINVNYKQFAKVFHLAVFALILSAFSSNVSAAETVNINTANA